MENIPAIPSIGKNIHLLRKKLSLSLDALAKLSGVSKAMLSQVETGKVNPTFATLWKIARGLGVDFNSLLGSQNSGKLFYIQRSESAILFRNPDKSCELKVLTPPQMVDELEQYWLTFEPNGALISEPHFAGTEEIITVLEGSVEIIAGEKSAKLGKGDCIRFHADMDHSIRETAGIKSQAYVTVYFKEAKSANIKNS